MKLPPSFKDFTIDAGHRWWWKKEHKVYMKFFYWYFSWLILPAVILGMASMRLLPIMLISRIPSYNFPQIATSCDVSALRGGASRPSPRNRRAYFRNQRKASVQTQVMWQALIGMFIEHAQPGRGVGVAQRQRPANEPMSWKL